MSYWFIAALLVASPAAAATLDFTEDLRIETAGTQAEIGEIASVVVAGDGTIYVGDNGFGVIHAFDESGEYLRSFGEAGEGPGDIPRDYFVLAVDGEDDLLVAGMRSSISRLDGNGDLLGSIPLGTVGVPRSLFCLPDGRVGFTSTMNWGNASEASPPLLHIVEGDSLHSFATSEWWDDSFQPHWSSALLAASAAVDPTTGEIVFLQAQPFDLRRYRPDGTLVSRSTEGFADFVTAPKPPEVDGDRVTFRFSGGSAGKLVVGPDGTICAAAFRYHPDDAEKLLEEPRDPDFEPRSQYAVAIFGPDLSAVAETRDEKLPWPRCFDREGRIWAGDRDEDGIPLLVRYTIAVKE